MYPGIVIEQEENKENPTIFYDYPHTFVKYISYFLAFGAEVGNFATSYYSLLITFDVVTEIIAEIKSDDSISTEAKAGCYLFAIHFAVHRLINDLLLIIPAENFQVIYEKLVSLVYERLDFRFTSGTNLLKDFFKVILNSFIMLTFTLLSADGVAGYMLIFNLPILIKTLGLSIASIGTLLGVTYSHFYYVDIINESTRLFNNCLAHPWHSLKNIISNAFSSLQVGKSFLIVSGYYSTITALYASSVIKILSEAFSFKVDANHLISFMKFSSASVCFTNFFIRYLPIKKKYFNDKFLTINNYQLMQNKLPVKFYTDVFLELLMSMSGIIFSLNYLTKNRLLGLIISSGSFVVSLPALYRCHLNQAVLDNNTDYQLLLTNPEPNSNYAAGWINVMTRIQKSNILLFAGFWKINSMFKEYGQVDLHLSLLDYCCLVIIFGIQIGANKTAIDIEKLAMHIKLLKAKSQIGRFGTFGSLFRSHKAYSPDEQCQLRRILKIAEEPVPLLEF